MNSFISLLISWIVYALAIYISANILPGIHITNFTTALVTAIILGIINVLIKPVLIILSLPINILTLGLFTLVINALLIMLAANLAEGFDVDGFWWALLFGIILSIVSSILFSILPTKRHGENI